MDAPVSSTADVRPGASALTEFGDPEVRNAFLQLFAEAQDAIDRSDVDAVVLASRRLPCMYEALLQAGMPRLVRAPVIGDHALDYIDQVQWKRVLVIDDTVILGSTLTELRKRVIESVGAVEVTTRAVCQDSKQSAPYMLRNANAKTLLKRDPHQVEEISAQIVRTLYRAGIPLFSDFPTTNEFVIQVEVWRHYLGDPGWMVADVTAPLMDGVGRTALVLIPTREKRWDGLAGMPECVSAAVEVIKIRAYVTPGCADQTVRVRLVPVGMLKPLSPDEIDDALSALANVLGLSGFDRWLGERSMEARQRLLQYLVSVYFLFRSQRHPEYPANISAGASSLDEVAMELSFGVGLRQVKKLIDALAVFAEQDSIPTASYPFVMNSPRPYPLLAAPAMRRIMGEHQELVAAVGLPEQPKPGEVTRVGLTFSHAVASIFGFIAEKYEKPQRRKLARLNNMEEYDAAIAQPCGSRVLSSGITLQELRRLLTLAPASDDEWRVAVISLALDIGNDLGIAVPMTRCDEVRNLVYRCFRFGETAVLASVPLGDARWSGGRYDEFSLSWRSGYPLKSSIEHLGTYPEIVGKLAQRKKPRRDALPRLVGRALPGRVRERYTGTVLSAETSGPLLVDLRDENEDDYGLAEIPWDALVPGDSELIREGSAVVWTVFERREESNILRSSRLHVVPEAVCDRKVAEARARRLAELLSE